MQRARAKPAPDLIKKKKKKEVCTFLLRRGFPPVCPAPKAFCAESGVGDSRRASGFRTGTLQAHEKVKYFQHLGGRYDRVSVEKGTVGVGGWGAKFFIVGQRSKSKTR